MTVQKFNLKLKIYSFLMGDFRTKVTVFGVTKNIEHVHRACE